MSIVAIAHAKQGKKSTQNNLMNYLQPWLTSA
jgi:hypothetical protein